MAPLVPAIALIVVGPFVAALLLQWLWNITMPDVFRLPMITYWQAFRLLLLGTLLLGGRFISFNL